MLENLEFLEKRGDVSFYQNSKGVMYQQLGANPPFRVRNGSIGYRLVCVSNGFTIKYNTNGVYGYVLFKGSVPMEDGFWSLAEVRKAAKDLRG